MYKNIVLFVIVCSCSGVSASQKTTESKNKLNESAQLLDVLHHYWHDLRGVKETSVVALWNAFTQEPCAVDVLRFRELELPTGVQIYGKPVKRKAVVARARCCLNCPEYKAYKIAFAQEGKMVHCMQVVLAHMEDSWGIKCNDLQLPEHTFKSSFLMVSEELTSYVKQKLGHTQPCLVRCEQ